MKEVIVPLAGTLTTSWLEISTPDSVRITSITIANDSGTDIHLAFSQNWINNNIFFIIKPSEVLELNKEKIENKVLYDPTGNYSTSSPVANKFYLRGTSGDENCRVIITYVSNKA